MKHVLRSWLMLLLLASLAASGCRREEPITRYSARRVEEPPARRGKGAALPPAKLEPGRFLGAIFPHLDKMWFVRMHGPLEKIAALEKDFDAFVRSFKFQDGAQPLAWKLPADWEEKPGGGAFRYATIRVPGSQEVIVSSLDRKANEGKLIENLDRFRREYINLPPLKPGQEKEVTREIDVGGTKITLVDMTGMVGGGKGKMPFDHPPIARKPPTNPFKADLPKGWELLAEEKGRYAVEAKEAIVTFEKQDRPDMDWLEVLKTWRGILAERGLDLNKLRSDRTSVDVGGAKLSAIELKLPDKAALFGLQVPVGKETWTFLLIGSAPQVAEQESDLLAFVRNIRTGPAKGDVP